MEANFVVIGGGIAGVSCAETLSILDSNCSVILISESALIKTAVNVLAVTKTLTSFEVKEDSFKNLCSKFPNVKIIHDILLKVNSELHTIETKTHLIIKYDYLCLCTGAFPKLIPQATIYPEIFGVRDTDSVEILIEKLQKSQKIAIVGNGGIATELIYQIKNLEIHWIIKDKHISSTFVDPGAAEFFESVLSHDKKDDKVHISKRMRYSQDSMPKSGAALGPDWYRNLCITGMKPCEKEVVVHYETEVQHVNKNTDTGCLEIILTNGKGINCDVIISATGVKANLSFNHNLELTEEGFIKVDEFMQTSLKGIYAAGDVCSAEWEPAKHWFQMKLWTQARQMGCYAAKCMLGHLKNEDILQDFCFEIFSHSTKLFGYKVILLGLFNGQKLGTNYEILLRMTTGQEYIKFVLENNKLQGALLIGDTDLEEMCENLILNQLDLSPYGNDILNPNIDIEDYFD